MWKNARDPITHFVPKAVQNGSTILMYKITLATCLRKLRLQYVVIIKGFLKRTPMSQKVIQRLSKWDCILKVYTQQMKQLAAWRTYREKSLLAIYLTED